MFHRHARGLILTEQGEELYHAAHDVYHQLAMAEARLTDSQERPQGRLKVSTTVGFGSVWLTPRMKEFLDAYPEIEVSIVLAYSEADLSMREADVAIRLTPPTQPDLIQRHLMTFRHFAYASPDYLKEHRMPMMPNELDEHKLITFGEEVGDQGIMVPALNFLLDAGVTNGHRRKPVLQVNNVYGIYRAVLSGLGIGALPDYIDAGTTNLVRVLPELQSPDTEVYYVYPEELRQSARIAVFRDFLIRKVREFRK